MKKVLPFLGLLLGLLLGNINLMAEDFTISGKVSLVQASVPLPFYEVNISDGTGDYVASVTTSFSGKYSHTFDIPANENVQFEVTVIDRCTGNSLIEAIEKEGAKVTVNFLVCDPNLLTGDDDDGDNGNDGDNNEGDGDDDDEGFGGFPDFLNCEALGLDIPVCVVEDNGNITEFENACIALDNGIKLNQLTLCDGLPGDGGGLGIGGGFDCDQLGFDLPINVCVTNADGETINLPLCDALDAGYPVSQIEFCDDLGGLGGLDNLDCEGLGINLPVCGTDADGNGVNFDTPCDAFDAGFELNQLSICGDILDGGLGGILDNLDCESLETDFPFTICLTNEAGETEEVQLCDALTSGLSFNELILCDGGMGLLDSIDCEGLGLNIPICGTDANGNEINFNNPCEALDAGFELNQLSVCGDILDGGLGGILDNFDCEGLEADIPFTVCVTNEAGETEEVQLCDALTSGLSFDELVLCDGGMGLLDSIDCEGLGLNIPICGTDADGNEINFNNPCEALDAGFELNQLSVCGDILDNGIEGILGDLDCESLSLSVDIPVCTTNEAGEQEELMLCEALTQGISLESIELCDGALDGVDCEGLGIALPVCTTDADGNSITFNNPCDALSAGIALNELTFCEGLIDSVLENIDCNTLDFELPIPVCITNDLGEQEELELCDALSQGIAIENIEICANTLNGIGSDDCEGLGLNIPVCTVDADGNKVEYANPCAAFEAGLSIEDLTFCDNLLEDVMEAAFSTTSTEEETVVLEKATLYPNPVSNNLTLNLEFIENSEYEVNIQSINGNAIYRQKYHAINGANVTNMDVSSLSAGIYLIQVLTTRGIKTMKFIKQ